MDNNSIKKLEATKVAALDLLVCPYDMSVIHCYKQERTVYKEQDRLFPLFKCPVCNRLFTSNPFWAEGTLLRIRETDFYNVLIDEESISNRKFHPVISPYVDTRRGRKFKQIEIKPNYKKRECYVYNQSAETCRNGNCHGKLIDTNWQMITQKKQLSTRHIKGCPVCGMFYLKYSEFGLFKDVMDCRNPEELEGFIKRVEELRKKQEPVKPVEIGEKPLKKAKKGLKLYLKEQMAESQLIYERRKRLEEIKQSGNGYELQMRDFVVRRSIYKCIEQNHSLVDINAKLNVIKKEGKIIPKTIPAGYCPNCDKFFILDTHYKMLKQTGCIMCRIIDEKTYSTNTANNEWSDWRNLAPESLLMQCGYSVSQKEDLSVQQRQRILSEVIDKKLMTREAVINHISYQIALRANKPEYIIAIKRWNEDIGYLNRYNTGEYVTYGVNSIKAVNR